MSDQRTPVTNDAEDYEVIDMVEDPGSQSWSKSDRPITQEQSEPRAPQQPYTRTQQQPYGRTVYSFPNQPRSRPGCCFVPVNFLFILLTLMLCMILQFCSSCTPTNTDMFYGQVPAIVDTYSGG